jgi:hypothetical protein
MKTRPYFWRRFGIGATLGLIFGIGFLFLGRLLGINKGGFMFASITFVAGFLWGILPIDELLIKIIKRDSKKR